ncbi:alpha/beta hydrolase [Bradyrhizobium sp. CCBAU 51765]|uniref:alpha/beta hydrolase n=1 Tax=Bradyrhizobium sp. CCBAU 51765 TaxID=1325102 RepID=UPI001886F7B8|nr:alpha/beta hydrolase [Bradyrhizobium sp. CCBAU 51765]QOZ10939.1 alpha/beta hydrolase [Bradyrhizobium sp. CCBAU 51765]
MIMETVDAAIIERTNSSQKQPVIFIHGLWSKPGFWYGWADVFEGAGFAPLAPEWPAELGGAAAPETIGEVASHLARIVGALDRRPALIGHTFGGLIAQILAGRGLSAATVAIEPASFGAVPPPVSTGAAIEAEVAARGPLLMICYERDHTLPPTVTRAAYEQQRRNKHAVTEFVQLPRRGRSLAIDSGWPEVAETALTFLRRFL